MYVHTDPTAPPEGRADSHGEEEGEGEGNGNGKAGGGGGRVLKHQTLEVVSVERRKRGAGVFGALPATGGGGCGIVTVVVVVGGGW